MYIMRVYLLSEFYRFVLGSSNACLMRYYNNIIFIYLVATDDPGPIHARQQFIMTDFFDKMHVRAYWAYYRQPV